MSAVKRFTDLIAWQKAMELVEQIYRVTKSFSKEELYGLTSQLRRSAVSVPSNVAEGHCRNGRREFVHHLSIALGSLGEILIAHRLGYLDEESQTSLTTLASETGRVVFGLMHSLERHAAAS
jgi:four helix bundle protein